MSLFPNEDVLTREIESWKGFAESLRTEEDRKLFTKMLNECHKYANDDVLRTVRRPSSLF